MSYKIEFYRGAKKYKHKLYDSEKMFNKMWEYHASDVDYFALISSHSIKGYVDGILVKEYPEEKK